MDAERERVYKAKIAELEAKVTALRGENSGLEDFINGLIRLADGFTEVWKRECSAAKRTGRTLSDVRAAVREVYKDRIEELPTFDPERP